MKLVDILARELKVWPANISCLWIGSGNTIYGRDGAHEYSLSGGWDVPDDHSTAVVYPAQWQAAVDALKASVWPCIGDEVQIQEGPASWSDQKDWIGREVKVAHTFKNQLDQNMALVEAGSGECACFIVECLRPILTPEQIAAEEEKVQVNRLVSEIEANYAKTFYTNGEIDLIEWVIALGYRKFEIVDN